MAEHPPTVGLFLPFSEAEHLPEEKRRGLIAAYDGEIAALESTKSDLESRIAALEEAGRELEARLAQVTIEPSPSVLLAGMEGARLPIAVAHWRICGTSSTMS